MVLHGPPILGSAGLVTFPGMGSKVPGFLPWILLVMEDMKCGCFQQPRMQRPGEGWFGTKLETMDDGGGTRKEASQEGDVMENMG